MLTRQGLIDAYRRMRTERPDLQLGELSLEESARITAGMSFAMDLDAESARRFAELSDSKESARVYQIMKSIEDQEAGGR